MFPRMRAKTLRRLLRRFLFRLRRHTAADSGRNRLAVLLCADSLSPFAIVVDANRDSTNTDDNSGIYLLIAVAALSLAAAVIFFMKSRKEIED